MDMTHCSGGVVLFKTKWPHPSDAEIHRTTSGRIRESFPPGFISRFAGGMTRIILAIPDFMTGLSTIGFLNKGLLNLYFWGGVR